MISRVALLLLLLGGCASRANADDELQIPDLAAGPTTTPQEADRRDEVDPPSLACQALIPKRADNVARRDFLALCRASTYDDSTVGLGGERTDAREGFECLLEAGYSDELVALSATDVPALRAYGWEAIDRLDRRSAQTRAAVAGDTAVVTFRSGCIVDTIYPATHFATPRRYAESGQPQCYRTLTRRWEAATKAEGKRTLALEARAKAALAEHQAASAAASSE